MIVEPYKKTPKIPKIALVNDEGIYLTEDGEHLSPNSEYKFRLGEIVCYIFWDTAISLARGGMGELLRWNTKDIRWRKTRYPSEDTWKSRPFDAGIIQYPISLSFDYENALTQLLEFRDWLVGEGARASCTFGGTSISLLKAKLSRKLFTGLGACPPIDYTRGGRMAMGLKGKGSFEGAIYNWDLPAAYAATLGNIRYDGMWQVRPYNAALKAYNHGAPVFCQAKLKIPDLPFGPLPNSIHMSGNPIESAIINRYGYPKSGEVSGIWTLDEILMAAEAGCEFTPLQCWTMLSGIQPFLPWWQAILRGRELTGLISRSLAKRTGNALWGLFCHDPNGQSKKCIVHFVDGKPKYRRIEFRQNLQRPGHDLAEAVSSSVRSRLFEHMIAANEHLLSAHTDGVWVSGFYDIPDGWRVKQQATRIDIIDPQTLRYFTSATTSHVVMAGIPPRLAPDKFATRWAHYERSLARKDNLQELQKSGSNKRRVQRISDPDNF